MHRVTRRRLLVGAALAGGGLLAGCHSADRPAEDKRVRWRVAFGTDMSGSFGNDLSGLGEPATVVTDGERVYATHGGSLYALDAASGKQLWQSPNGSLFTRPNVRPPVLAGGVLYLLREPQQSTPADRVLKAVDAATGALRWEFGEPGGFPRPWPAVGDGRVCLATTGGFAVLDASTGKGLWAHAHRIAGVPLPFGQPVIDHGAIYLTDDGGDLGSFRLDRDETRWGLPGSSFQLLNAAIAVDGDIVVASGASGLTTYDSATGKKRWSAPVDPAIHLSTDVVIAGNVIVAIPQPATVQNERVVSAFSRADGAKAWTYTAKGDLGGVPVVAGGVVYVPAKGFLHAVDATTGAERWTVATDKGTFGTPAVGAGTVYSFALRAGNGIDDLNNYLYAIAV